MSTFRSSGDLSADRRYLWADASRKEGDLEAACELFEQATEAAPEWAAAWFALGETRQLAGDRTAAAAAFQRCLACDPADAFGASLRLGALAGKDTAMPAAYVAGLFDEYATRFDSHLTGTLDYRGPALLLEAIDACGFATFERVLDLGCGTGLMAAALAGRFRICDGVDLSPGMLREAAKRHVYRGLVEDDVVGFLLTVEPAAYDLIIAADVLVYLGDLAPLFKAAHAALASNGLVAFTVQSQPGAGFSLGADMRFAHARQYIDDTARSAGFEVVSIGEASTRLDAGRPVPGLVCVLTA